MANPLCQNELFPRSLQGNTTPRSHSILVEMFKHRQAKAHKMGSDSGAGDDNKGKKSDRTPGEIEEQADEGVKHNKSLGLCGGV